MHSPTNYDCQVAIVGAGPYGLSLAAHFAAANIHAVVFGEVMSFWQHCMPNGMKLRSPWGATHFSDPASAFTLDRYEETRRLTRTEPLPVDKFIRYGKWFERQIKANVDSRRVTSIGQLETGFRLVLEDEVVVHARRVVIATGLANQEFRPRTFRELPPSLVSHTCEHRSLEPLRGKSIAVVGRGQSACEYATLLRQVNAEAEIICRGPIHWVATSESKNPVRRLSSLLAAPSGVGPFPLNWIVELPNITRHSPSSIRTALTKRCVRPGAAAWLLPEFDGVRVNHTRSILATKCASDRVELRLDSGTLQYDHVLLATGYRTDISKLGIFSAATLARIDQINGSPRLTAQFESSLPDLYFVGSYAVESFGPLVRFIAGAAYTARTLTSAIMAADSVREHAASRHGELRGLRTGTA